MACSCAAVASICGMGMSMAFMQVRCECFVSGCFLVAAVCSGHTELETESRAHNVNVVAGEKAVRALTWARLVTAR